jgi:hypothetical protein
MMMTFWKSCTVSQSVTGADSNAGTAPELDVVVYRILLLFLFLLLLL